MLTLICIRTIYLHAALEEKPRVPMNPFTLNCGISGPKHNATARTITEHNLAMNTPNLMEKPSLHVTLYVASQKSTDNRVKKRHNISKTHVEKVKTRERFMGSHTYEDYGAGPH